MVDDLVDQLKKAVKADSDKLRGILAKIRDLANEVDLPIMAPLPVEDTGSPDCVAHIVDSFVGPNHNQNSLLKLELRRFGPGNVYLVCKIDESIRTSMPFDNLVKAMTRIDPDHASGPEKQIAELRNQLAEANGKVIDSQLKETQLRTQITELNRMIKGQDASIVDMHEKMHYLETDLANAKKAIADYGKTPL